MQHRAQIKSVQTSVEMAECEKATSETLSVEATCKLLDLSAPTSVTAIPVRPRERIQIGADALVKKLHIGPLVSSAKEVVERFVVWQKLHGSDLQAIQGNLRCIDINDNNLSWIGDQVCQRIASSRTDGDQAVVGFDTKCL
jgi:hypothetical protein